MAHGASLTLLSSFHSEWKKKKKKKRKIPRDLIGSRVSRSDRNRNRQIYDFSHYHRLLFPSPFSLTNSPFDQTEQKREKKKKKNLRKTKHFRLTWRRTDGRNFGSLFLSPWKKKNICPVQGGCGRVLLAESVKTTHRSNSICACPSAGPTFNEHKRKRGEPQHTTGASCLLFSSLLLDSRCAASPFISQPNSYPVPSVRPSVWPLWNW